MRKILTLLFITFLISMTVFAQTKPRLAILPFTGGTGTDGETMAVLLGNQSELRNAFITVPRTANVEAVMKEQQFQQSGLTDSDTIAKLGKQMNAEYVVSGHIQKFGTRNILLISIIHVEKLQQIAGDYKEYNDISEIRAYLPNMVRKIVTTSKQDTSNLPKLAITPFNILSKGVNLRDAEVLAHVLSAEIANTGKYAVLPRTSIIENAMREHSIQRSGITDSASIKRIGQAANANFVLAGSISSLDSMNLFLAQIINVESGELVTGDDKEYKNITDGLTKMADIAKTLSYNQGGVSPEQAKFLGSWTATVGYNNSFDTYKINLSTNGLCTVKLSNNTAEQEANGNWSYDGNTLKLDAVFKNVKIAYQNNIKWISVVNFSEDNKSFNILAKPAVNGQNVRFKFLRD